MATMTEDELIKKLNDIGHYNHAWVSNGIGVAPAITAKKDDLKSVFPASASGPFIPTNAEPSNADFQLDELKTYLTTHFPEISRELGGQRVVNIAMQIIERMKPDYIERTGVMPDHESLKSQTQRLGEYILAEWPCHPAWQCAGGACDVAIGIMKACKVELAAVDRSCPNPSETPTSPYGDSSHVVINDPNGGRR